MMIRTFFCSLLTLGVGLGSWSIAYAADYHVDNVRGDDANPGTADQPWKTLGRVKAAVPRLQAGDRVLLRRGGTWEGESVHTTGAMCFLGLHRRPHPPSRAAPKARFSEQSLVRRPSQCRHRRRAPARRGGCRHLAGGK